MNIKKKHLIIIGSAMVAACSIVLLANSQSPLVRGDASDVHNANCSWNHYDAVEATYNHYGSKEFYACCSHPGNVSFEKPSEGNVLDMGAFSGTYFDSLTSDDARYIPSLYEGMDVLYDCKEQTYVPKNYSPASWTSTAGKVDSKYGYYCNLQINETSKEGDWVWLGSASTTDISGYKQIIFSIRSNQDVTIQLNGYDSAAINSDKYALSANVWTEIVYNVSNGATTLDQIAPSFWIDKVRTDLVWDITSIYGVATLNDPFDGMDNIFDTSSNPFAFQQYWPVTSDNAIFAGQKDSKFGSYCRIKFDSLTNDGNHENAWVKPNSEKSITDYKEAVFYMRSNQSIDGLIVMSSEWKQVASNINLIADTWTKITVTIDGTNVKILNDIAPAKWNAVYTNLIWDITSIYGVK